MNKIDKMFRNKTLNHWLYCKIDELFDKEYCGFASCRVKGGMKEIIICIISLSVICSVAIGLMVYGMEFVQKNTPVILKLAFIGVCFGAALSLVVYIMIERFYVKRFMYHYNRLQFAFTKTGDWCHALNSIQCNLGRAIEENGPVFFTLLDYFMQILRIERELGKVQSESPEWVDLAQAQVLAREDFRYTYELFLLFGLIADPDKGWTPYKEKAEAKFAVEYSDPTVVS